MAGAVDATNCEEKQLPNKRETMIWKPRKECLLDNISNVPDSKSEESEASDAPHSEGDHSVSPDDWYNVHEGDGVVSSIPDSPKLQSASEHEVEDWDKELEESACGPYDADDLSCGSFQENNVSASYVWKEDWFYYPSCHHTASFVSPPPVSKKVESGQFDDADE
ncbi:PREDICTED: coordinator of PRMT5 and differentiation stimulator isoform X3 [Lepidothrix coronata]|nr:PREDICTED: coordinator of PRMT5 and differentiation stimulator isoform X3 [Lepidothrix coronata]XP_017667614.1 PREDICTED: coordinator of PRMT5 and differentiation stimulator isoform X3 [Lepidothrix coronata]XP_017667615.1 PREDICTED: coordinator of PRMT5 and differentiation stimulator isoform X3 [Lepidothrix coronata]XP_017667616.1 PREDICTED: coordinator of PRMT5 and differentiation stimulator isoform X3 [Lepidothrix coronata]XP_017667617.1 PREDICTED: coordinator of PRMT5 and differentiation 